MPLYLDIHRLEDMSREDLANAHEADSCVQEQHGVNYLHYWHNEDAGKVFCLVEAPTAAAAAAVHREAHGLIAEKIIEVDRELADGFLGGVEANTSGAVVGAGGVAEERDPGTRTIFFTDIVGSTAATQRLGDEGAMAWLGVHDEIVRGALGEFGGREVKHTGDGIMTCFASVASALQCASRIQRDLRRHNDSEPRDPLYVRIGAAAGEPIERGQDLFGAAVQLAARLCQLAQPEQILVPRTLAELSIGKALCFGDVSEVTVKGFAGPIHVCNVDWERPA